MNKLFNKLKDCNFTIASCESFTGGLFGYLLTQQPGASQVYRGSLTTYTFLSKMTVAGVKEKTLHKYGTVSMETAKEMAQNVCQILGSDIGISFTGVAGPEMTESKEVGLVFIGIYYRHNRKGLTFKYHFKGERKAIIDQAIQEAIKLLQEKTYL